LRPIFLRLARWVVAVDAGTVGLLAAHDVRLLVWALAALGPTRPAPPAPRSAPAGMRIVRGEEALSVLRAMLGGSPGSSPKPQVEPFSPERMRDRIAEVLGKSPSCIMGMGNLIVDLHVGEQDLPDHRSLTRDEWEQLRSAGLDLLPWHIIVQLRVAITTDTRGDA
jgi:hypothetical protein